MRIREPRPPLARSSRCSRSSSSHPSSGSILAPTKSDHALITSSPFSFGSFHNVAQAWKHLDAYSDHLYRRWIGNTLIYSLSATAITLAVSIPAGYGLALGKFWVGS